MDREALRDVKDKPAYLRSCQKRGRWFHYYRRNGKEAPLGVHGLHPSDKRVFAAYCAAHARYEESNFDTPAPKSHTFAWGLDLYLASPHWKGLAEETQKHRKRLLLSARAKHADRPLVSITQADLEAALIMKGGNPARHDLKALKPVFKYLKAIHAMPHDPAAGVVLDAVKSKGFATASAEDIKKFMKRWPVGTTERLVFDLAIYTGAARVDLCALSRKNITGGVIRYERHKTGTEANVPLTPELRAVIGRTPDIAPAFILNSAGKPYTKESLGNLFGEAAREAGMKSRLHGLRKAFCVYWAEKGYSAHQIASMAGHETLAEVERYTKEADRRRIVALIVDR